WSFKVTDKTFLTPFTELSYNHASVDGWKETGGPFPAVINGFDSNATIGRIGLAAKSFVSETTTLFGSVAWAHIFDAQSPTVMGSLLVADCDSADALQA